MNESNCNELEAGPVSPDETSKNKSFRLSNHRNWSVERSNRKKKQRIA